MLRCFRVLVSLMSASVAVALPCFGQAIHVDAARMQWTIDTGTMSYVVGVNEEKMVQTVYWGPRLAPGAVLPMAKMGGERSSFDPAMVATPLEYAGFGAGLYTEPALKVDSADGDRTVVLEYADAHVTGDLLELVLRDKVKPIVVHLYYQGFAQGVVARWSRIENAGKTTIKVEQAASATWNLPRGTGYEWSWLTGQWAGEWQLHTAAIQAGAQVIESRRGSTSHEANPWFAVGKTKETTERAGPVWFGELGWSGSWKMAVEGTTQDDVRITGGFNPFDFEYALKPGESLGTPKFYAGYTAGGRGEASRILHRFQREVILPTHPDPKPRPIIYNSWEATEFNVSEAGQIALAEKAAKLGVELFVIDDGWFGARKDDHAGLGDWVVNKEKFPNGLKPVIDRVHGLGMKFGLWFEPEMVNPDSDLYRKHPEWAMNFPGRQRTEMRNQLLLNLARTDVKEYVFGFLDKTVSENDIAFIKWDYNRNWSEPGWAGADSAGEKAIYVKYVENLYEIFARLRKKHPGLEIETCSGGGGRVDLGILQYTDEVWTSDNTDALDRLSIQYGFSQAYAPQVMVAWVTDVPNMDHRFIPLQFRFLVAMQGALGVGSNLNKMPEAELAESAQLVNFYKGIRDTVQTGGLYRLASPEAGDAAQVEYVAKDGSQAVLLAYLHSQRYRMAYPTVKLEGLDATAIYRVRALDAAKYKGAELVSGSVLMGDGVRLGLTGDYDSTALVLEKVK